MIKHKGNIQTATNEFLNDKNNAVSFVYENAKFSEGLLNGATISIKDLFATKDAKTQASSKILDGFTPNYDATIVEKLRTSGAAIIGKTHMDELALGGTGTLSGYGVITNPLDSSRMVGGSSSGAAATLTNAISIAVGSDTGDSVRQPASLVGKVGFKPSYGAVSRFGMYAFASSLDTAGWLTHNVNDAIVASQALFGQDVKDMTSKQVTVPTLEVVKPKQVAVIKNVWSVLSPAMTEQFNSLIAKLKADGVEVVEVEVKQELLDLIGIVYSIISFSEASSNDANLTGVIYGNRVDADGWDEVMTQTRSKHFGKMVQRRLSLGAYFLSTENQQDIFVRAQKVRRLIVEMFNDIYEKYNFVISPSTKIAPKITEGKIDDWFTEYLIHSNFEGSPSITIPFGKEEGMPFGLSIDSKIYNDKALLSAGLYLEKLIGGDNE